MNFDKRLAFRGIRALYGNDGFEKLQSSHVTVIGVGGIGSWAVSYTHLDVYKRQVI